MPKKLPGFTKTDTSKFYTTKGAANKAAIQMKKDKAKQGYNFRYDVQFNEQTGQYTVKEMYYMKDKKGRLI